MANLIEDINAAHAARAGNAASSALIARLLLTRYSAEAIFACAEKWAMSTEIREAIRYNGAVGIVDLKEELSRTITTPDGKTIRIRPIQNAR